MINNRLIILFVILGESLLSQDFNSVYTEKSYYDQLYSSCCLKDGRCLIIREDTAKKYSDTILYYRHFKLTPIITIYDTKGNLIAKKPCIYMFQDTMLYFIEFIELDGKLFGRAIQTLRYRNDSFYQSWMVYQEWDKQKLEPKANKLYKSYIGLIKLSSGALRNSDLYVYTSQIKTKGSLDYKPIYVNRYSTSTIELIDTGAYILFSFNATTGAFSSVMTKSKSIYDRPITQNTALLKNKITTIGNGSFDTFGNSYSIETLYNVNYNYNFQKTDTFLLKQDISKFVIPIPFGSNNPYIDLNDTIHQFTYSTFYEKQGGKYEKYVGFLHFKIKDSHFIFNRVIDDRKLAASIQSGTPSYRPIENILSAPNSGFYVILHLNSLFPKPSGVRVYRLNANYDIIWKRDYSTLEPIYEMWLKNDGKLRAFENEVGGFTMFFEAEDLDAKVGIYCLKIDSTGKAIKLEGKDLTKTAIDNPSSIDNSISIYPNPAKNYIQINAELADKKKLGLEIFDLIGKKLASISPDGQGRYDIKSINRGLYIVRLMDSNGDILNQQRLQIERD
jgi:hypothetical protein